jgi:hypothetical protein
VQCVNQQGLQSYAFIEHDAQSMFVTGRLLAQLPNHFALC